MTSLDPESLRRAQAEQRIAMQTSNDGSSAMWFLAVVVFVAIIGGVVLFGGDGSTATETGAIQETAPAAAEDAAPATQ